MVTLILFIVIFGMVVLSHELGHFLLAKASGIHVLEFALGMGPTIFSVKGKETKYSVKLLPLGGACMFEGEDEAETPETGEGSFLKASAGARAATIFAGPLFNMIFAFLIALILVSLVSLRLPIATRVLEGSAAMEAGLQDGDRIVSLNGEKIHLYQEMSVFNTLYRSGEVEVVFERDGERYTTMMTPKYDEAAGAYRMGIENDDWIVPRGLKAFEYAWYELEYSVKMTYKSLGMMLQGQVSRKDVAGPVGLAVNVVGKTYEATKEAGFMTVFVNMLNLMVMLSVNLGIINLLPLPALDGGRLVFILWELISGKPIPSDKEGMVHFIGFALLMVLMVFLFFNDLSNIFFK